MLVLSYGITKSGSTLAYQLARTAAITAGYEQAMLPPTMGRSAKTINYSDDLSPDNLARMMELCEGKGPLLVKTHTRPSPESFQVIDDLSARGLIKVHVVYRDPREICLSLCDAGQSAREKGFKAFSEYTTVDTTLGAVTRQIETFRSWAAVSNALVMFYDDIAFDMERTLREMCAHLGLTVPLHKVIHVATELRFTQKNKAVPKRYLTDMSAEDLDRTSALFADFIQKACVERDLDWIRAGSAPAA